MGFLGRREPKLIFTFSEALKHASKLKFCGHKDWRVPTKNELNELFNNRAAIGGFCEIDHFDYGPYYWDRLTMNAPPLPDAWRSSSYWSSSHDDYGAYGQSFTDGSLFNEDTGCHCSLRCVR